jgi:hypothetical protein
LIFHFHQIVTKHSLYYPFVSFQPYFGQNPRATETWNITTIRAELHLNLDKENIQEATDLVKTVKYNCKFTQQCSWRKKND